MIRESQQFYAGIRNKFDLSTATHRYFCARLDTRLFGKHLILLDAKQELAKPAFAMRADTRPRLSEIAEILAAGLMRLSARKSSQISADFGESSVDFYRHQRGHVDPTLWSSTHEGSRAGAPTEGDEPQSALEEGESD